MSSDMASGAGPFNVGEAARLSNVSAKMVRHYESLGLLPAVSRTDAGYRQYTGKEVHTLRFIRRARDLGFSMAEIAELLKLWQNRRRPSASVKRIASAQIAALDAKMAEMAAMRKTLQHLVHCCQGDDRPECPILDELAHEGRSDHAHEPGSGR
ncbi:MAG TPA: Cu(I)-responsive transcriptional regulator [Ramlibacter sp.]|nr:Cu(I)-responsive transcriptional regulator [Ramlibacter sp.]